MDDFATMLASSSAGAAFGDGTERDWSVERMVERCDMLRKKKFALDDRRCSRSNYLLNCVTRENESESIKFIKSGSLEQVHSTVVNNSVWNLKSQLFPFLHFHDLRSLNCAGLLLLSALSMRLSQR